MLRIDRLPEPEFWIDYKRKNPQITYSKAFKTKDGKQNIRNLREHFIHSQYYLCAYCCRRITFEDSLIEHIKPQSGFSNLTMDYDNMIANCRSEGEESTCSNKKGSKYDEQMFISPLDENCNSHFSFSPNGEIFGETAKGSYMIDLLGLQSYKLKRARAAKIKECFDYHDKKMVQKFYLTPIEGKLEPFCDTIESLLQVGYYDEEC